MNSYGRNARFPLEDQSHDSKRKITKREEFTEFIDDHEEKQSLMGHRPSEYDEGLALNYHEDDDHPHEISRVHSDEEIKSVILELLGNSKKIEASQIEVKVHQACVVLSGTVRTQSEKDYVTSIIKLVHGVGDIQSHLIVKGSSSHVGG